MFNTGFVIYYVKEYSKNEANKVKNILLKFVENNNLIPAVRKGTNLDNLVNNLPVGTIICLDMSNKQAETAVVCFPMFSSHISLPVKPGEIIWYYKDNISKFSAPTEEGAPLLSVNSFWISRKIGAKISEDLNFTSFGRDSLINNTKNNISDIDNELNNKKVDDKKRNKELKKEESKKVSIPDYKSAEAFSNKYNFLPQVELVHKENIQSGIVYPNAVPRWFSKAYELTLQGSNNSTINLTKVFNTDEHHQNKGAIDLVAGRHTINDYTPTEPDDFHIIKDKFAKNISDSEKREIKELKFDKTNPILRIKNASDHDEILKDQEHYFGEEFIENTSEGNASFVNDASRIYITEFDAVDSFSIYDISNFQNQKIINDSKEEVIGKKSNKKSYLKTVQSVDVTNATSEEIDAENKLLPSVLIKSNNIRLIAREKKENKEEEKTLEEGSIRLIKDSNSFQNYSHIALERNGNIAIDGKSIFLGNFNKELIRQKIIIDDKPDVDFEQKDLLSMHGEGRGLLIGYDENLSEPLVLGNTLTSILKEMININIQLVEEVKTLTDDLQKHVHLGIPGSGISGPPQIPKPYVDFSSTKRQSLNDRYANIQKNLKEILSRFAKTS